MLKSDSGLSTQIQWPEWLHQQAHKGRSLSVLIRKCGCSVSRDTHALRLPLHMYTGQLHAAIAATSTWEVLGKVGSQTI